MSDDAWCVCLIKEADPLHRLFHPRFRWVSATLVEDAVKFHLITKIRIILFHKIHFIKL